jgi:8-oxo-dGTP pyrophosphatase MutT (NUDIX family)/transcriptional regulator with XRE-family HTH domain
MRQDDLRIYQDDATVVRMPSDDSTPRVPLGPIGGYVIANLAKLRAERRLSYKDLSDRLTQLGRPIPTLGLSRVEKGTRRVDADDLVALAIALNVSPIALLLPHDTGPYEEIELTSGRRATARAAWEWSAGNFPLVVSGAPSVGWREIAEFEADARPAWHAGPGLAEWRDDMERRRAEIDELRRQVAAAEDALRVERARNGHAEEPAQPVVAAIVTSALGVLVGRRHDRIPPWGFISGEIEPGELPEDAAVREVKEETGLEVRAGEVIGERDHPATGRHMIYMAAKPTRGIDVFVGDEAELAEVSWVDLDEADELLPGMFGPVRDYLARVLGEA